MISFKKFLLEMNKNNWVIVTGISVKRAKWLISHSKVTVSNFKPDYLRKALNGKPSAADIYGLFNRYDRDNALALCTIIRNYGPDDDCIYLWEMTGFMKGGAGRMLIEKLMKIHSKLWLQCGLKEENGKAVGINDGLANGCYRKIAGLKEYTVQNSIWDCPANFFYAGIDDETMKKYLEESYGKSKE